MMDRDPRSSGFPPDTTIWFCLYCDWQHEGAPVQSGCAEHPDKRLKYVDFHKATESALAMAVIAEKRSAAR